MMVQERVFAHPEVSEEARNRLDEMREHNRNLTVSWAMAMIRLRKHYYRGTVPAAVKNKRRAANRVARASRKANR